MMKDGHAQVFTLGTTAPASAVMDLASARDIELVPVDDKTMSELSKQNPGYHKITIKAGTYPKQDKDVPVIGYSTHIIVACDLPEDTVYRMAKAMAGNVDAMAAVVKPIDGLTAKDMAVDIGVPFHKGAVEVLQGSRRDVACGARQVPCDGAASRSPCFHVSPGLSA